MRVQASAHRSDLDFELQERQQVASAHHRGRHRQIDVRRACPTKSLTMDIESVWFVFRWHGAFWFIFCFTDIFSNTFPSNTSAWKPYNASGVAMLAAARLFAILMTSSCAVAHFDSLFSIAECLHCCWDGGVDAFRLCKVRSLLASVHLPADPGAVASLVCSSRHVKHTCNAAVQVLGAPANSNFAPLKTNAIRS